MVREESASALVDHTEGGTLSNFAFLCSSVHQPSICEIDKYIHAVNN